MRMVTLELDRRFPRKCSGYGVLVARRIFLQVRLEREISMLEREFPGDGVKKRKNCVPP
jgi:hypothetical protein